MSAEYLQLPVDIHCGGADHIRVHHTNEIAQTEAATGKQFVRFWLHGEFLISDKGKMAKSGEDFTTLRMLREKGFSPLAYRMFCFTAHYRNQLTFSWEGLTAAQHSLDRMRTLIPTVSGGPAGIDPVTTREILEPFFDAVHDDLNMPRAVAALWDILRDNRFTDAQKCDAVHMADTILGLDLASTSKSSFEYENVTDGMKIHISTQTQLTGLEQSDIYEKIHQRVSAKKIKNYKEADRIRDELTRAGGEVKDMPDGTTVVVFK
jgi:cysteinyl-tRNA synthetase